MKYFAKYFSILLITLLFILMHLANVYPVSAQDAPYVKVNSPNGGECLTSGTIYYISWEMSG
ncbi:MAG: hypothetical protein ACK4NX_01975, partial [Candidatus Paceibacteria bacterium]